MQESLSKEILKKYIEGQCSPEELKQVKSFLSKPGHQEVLDELILEESIEEWNASLLQPLAADAQMEQWQSKFEQRKNKQQSKPDVEEADQSLVPKIRFNYMKYAAIWLVLMLGIGFYALQYFKSANPAVQQQSASSQLKEFRTKAGERATVTLSDGTIIYLGPGSRLSYPGQFKGKTRSVSLVGEAFFEVAHNPAKPFQIQSGYIKTTVLGTSFKVNAFEGQAFEVKVATGKVGVERTEGKNIGRLAILTPGQQVKLNAIEDEPILTELPVSDVLGWKKSKLAFRDNTLKEIAQQLERAYDVNIRFGNAEKAKEVMTVTLQVNVPLNETLQLLSKGAGFKFRIDGKKITIK